MDDGDDVRPTTITFAKKRNRQKAGGLTAASSAASSSTSSARHTPARDLGDEEEEDAGGVVVKTATRRRGGGGASGVASTSGARRPPPSASRLSSRTTLLAADGEGDAEDSFAASSSAIKAPRSGLALPSNLDQASIAAQTDSSLPIASSSSSHYSAQALADLRAASSRRMDNGDKEEAATMSVDEYGHPTTSDLSSAPTAFKTLDDPTAASTGHDSAAFFGSEHLDGASGSMPSQAVIEAAKEQRRRRALAAAEGAGGSEDFVSLSDQGPPSSRSVVRREDRLDSRRGRDDGTVPSLRREEDEEGSGEDEFADFTGAQDRITLDAAKRQKEVERQKREEAAQRDDDDSPDDGEDDDDDEFERVQLRRMGAALRQEREQNQRDTPRRQHKSAPLPAITPLPGPSAARLRLEARLASLNETQSSHEALVSKSTSTLSTLASDEETNKSSVTAWSEKEAWSRELATFVESLAQLLEERWGRLEDVEKEWDEVLEKKTRLTQRVRAKEMEDELSLFWGVPGRSILPPSKGKVKSADAMDEDEEESEAGPREEPSPVEDGEATSPLRTQRRETGPVPANQSAAVLREVTLTPADAAGFIEAQSALQGRLDSLLENVKAPEFLWPAATIDDEGGKPHPSSVHSRFLEWRTRYPDDYAKTWGSLALAGVWEFWAQKEVALSDLATLDVEGSACMGALYQYVEECNAVDEAGEAGGIGGSDEEVIGTLVNTAFVTRLLRLSTTAYDPWSSQQTAQAHRLLVSMADVLPRTSARFQSVVTALLEAFGEHIQRLQEVLCDSNPALQPPGFHPLSIPARLAFTTRLVGGEGSLLGNLATFARVAKSGQSTSGGATKQQAVLLLENLVDTLVSRIAWPLMRECGEAGGQRLAKGVLELLAKRGVSIQVDLKARFEGLAAGAT